MINTKNNPIYLQINDVSAKNVAMENSKSS